jgi:phospholipase/carboxylesterase
MLTSYFVVHSESVTINGQRFSQRIIFFMNTHPHYGQPVSFTGTPLPNATSAMILVHGRGGDAQDILAMTTHFTAKDVAYFAPQAQNFTWYPNRFIAPRASNEPFLSSGQKIIADLITHINQGGVTTDKIMLLGFSQGSCMVLEYAIRNPQRYGAVFGLSGGLIGAQGELVGYTGSLAQTPIFLGCSDIDDHIPVGRVHESADMLAQMGASVTKRIYAGMGHTINQDEIDFINQTMSTL